MPAIKLPELPGTRIGFALVGLGTLAINQLMPAFAQCRRAKLVGLVSGRPEKAKHLAQLYGVDAKNIYTHDNCDRLGEFLTNSTIAHEFENYPGRHTSGVAVRFQERVLPFFSRTLSFELGKASNGERIFLSETSAERTP